MGWIPARRKQAPIAQWIERRIAVPKVRGSSPLGGTRLVVRMAPRSIGEVAGSTPVGRTMNQVGFMVTPENRSKIKTYLAFVSQGYNNLLNYKVI